MTHEQPSEPTPASGNRTTDTSGAGPALGFARDGLYDLLWQVTAQTHLLTEQELVDTPLTAASASLLATIVAEPGMSVAEITRRIPKTQQTISQSAARLEKLGLVERRLRQGRGIGLHPTDEGLRVGTMASTREARVEQRLRELLGAERSVLLTELLTDARRMLADDITQQA